MITNRVPCSVGLGEDLDLEVESRASSGYRWQMETPEGAAWKVVDFGSRVDPARGATKLVWRVTMLLPGRWSIAFCRRRPWESAPAEERIFDIQVAP